MVIKVAPLKFHNMNIHNNGGMALAIIATAISPFPNYTQYQTKATLSLTWPRMPLTVRSAAPSNFAHSIAELNMPLMNAVFLKIL